MKSYIMDQNNTVKCMNPAFVTKMSPTRMKVGLNIPTTKAENTKKILGKNGYEVEYEETKPAQPKQLKLFSVVQLV
jgi:hypothetical protein